MSPRGPRKKSSKAASQKTPVDNPNRMRAGGCLDESFLVEAGAGTGKTALLMERLRNIICVRGVPMDGIAAITFTEKAAAELKSRLRGELEEWAAVAEGEKKENASAALGAIDRAAVCTIHSFCSTLIRERPVEAGVDPGFAVADEAEAEELRDWAWDSWLQDRMVTGNQKLRPVFSMGLTIAGARALADSLLRARDILDWIPAPDQLLDPHSTLTQIQERMDSFRILCDRDLKNDDDKLLDQAHKVTSFLEWAVGVVSPGAKDTGLAWLELAPAMAGLNLRTKRTGAATNWASKESLGRARELLSEIGELTGAGAGAFNHNSVVFLCEELKDYVSAYDKIKEDRGVLDFDDLLIKARDLLQNNRDVRRYYKKKFKAILIDEFQDTDPLQAEVAFLLAEKPDGDGVGWDEVELERGKLFIVGDPKQSIYRFRGADIEIYERSKKVLKLWGDVIPISVNFRSAPGVIDPVNLTFADVMRPPEIGNYQPEYIPLDAHREDDGPGVILLRPDIDFPEIPPADDRRAFEASAIAWSIQDAVKNKKWMIFDKNAGENRPATYGDIAMLFRATTGLNYYEEALRSWEVPYRVAGGKAFYSRAEVRALTSVLTAVEHPHDGVAVFGALRSVFFGMSDEEIFLQWSVAGSLNYTSVEVGGAVEEAFEVLRELRERRNSMRLVTFLELLFEKTGVLPSLYMRPQGEQRVANLLKMSAMASKLEESGPGTFKRFVRWVSDQGDREVDEGESPVRETGDDFVTVLTIHKAKGLEFPVVFLPGLWSPGRKGAGAVVADREAKSLQVCLNKKLGLLTREYVQAAKRESDVLEAERIRLLYVAMTRARDKLILPCLFGAGPATDEEEAGSRNRKTPGNKGGKLLGHFVHLTALLEAVRSGRAHWAEVKKIPQPGLERRREGALRAGGTGAKKTGGDFAGTKTVWREDLEETIKLMTAHAPVTSPTALLAPFEETEGPGEDAAAPGGYDFTAGAGMKIGSLVHSVLEIDPDWDSASMEKLAASLGVEKGLPSGAIDHAVGLLKNFSGSKFAIRLRKARYVGREVPFCLPLEATVEGVADLVIEEDDGWRVVDFKTDGVNESEVKDRAEHYRLQGACYALCLSKIIDKPIQQVIFYFLSPQKAYVFDVNKSLLDEARAAINAAAAP